MANGKIKLVVLWLEIDKDVGCPNPKMNKQQLQIKHTNRFITLF